MDKRPRQPVIKSRINKRRAKDDVVKSMDMKLASGPALIFAKDDLQRARKASAVLSMALIYGSLIFLGVISIGVFKFVMKPKQAKVLSFVEPTASLEQEFTARRISVDQYATYLCYLVARFDEVPEKYRTGIPRFDTESIYGKLREIWPQLKPATRDEIGKFLPDLATSISTGQ